jgi:hypothetical protein
MFHLPIILVYYHLLIPTSASSLLYTLNDVRYSLSDRIVTIPKLGAIRGLSIGYEHAYHDKYHLVNVEAFLGIQYGLYHGRFEPSKERFDLHSSTQVKKHIEFGPACSQFIWKNQTDLSRIRTSSFARDYYMNIYQPQMKDLQGKRAFDRSEKISDPGRDNANIDDRSIGSSASRACAFILSRQTR